MDPATLVLVHLVLLHTVDGRETLINPDQVASISSRVEGEQNRLLVQTVQCVLSLTNGKLVSVREHCDEVKQKLEDAR